MARVYHIQPRALHTAVLIVSSIVPSGSLSLLKTNDPPGLNQAVAGTIAPAGDVSSVVQDPSLITVPQPVDGSITPGGNLLVESPGAIILFQDLSADLLPIGDLASEASGPSYVTIEQSLDGEVTLMGDESHEVNVDSGTITASHSASITPSGDPANVVTGPSLVTVLKSIDGTITPSGDVTTLVGEVDIQFDVAASGTITPVGSVAREVSGPSLVTILQSVSGTLTPTSSPVNAVIDPATVTVTKSISGGITCGGTVAKQITGPSLVTIPVSRSGGITPAGSILVAITKRKKVFGYPVSSAIAPAGTVATDVSGPSFVKKFKSVGGTITPAGSETRQVTGPSLITVPNAASGGITPSSVLTRNVLASPIVTKSVSGSIAPWSNLVFGPVNIFKGVAGSITPHGVITITSYRKSVAGSITPSSTVARSIVGVPVVITKSIAGSFAPSGVVTLVNQTNVKSVSGGVTPHAVVTSQKITPPQPGNPLYSGWMGHDYPTWDEAPHFTSTQVVVNPSSLVAARTAARASGFKVAMRLSGNSPAYSDRDGSGQLCCFRLADWKAGVARYVGLISAADKDWLVLSYLIDEPYINNWYGNTLTPNILKEMAQYSKSLYPWLPTTIRAESKYLTGGNLPTGGWGGFLDFGWANYNRAAINNNQTYAQYFKQNTDDFAAIGIGCILGQNLFNSGHGESGIPSNDGVSGHWFASANEIKACFDAAYPYTSNKIYQMWKLAATGDSTEPYIPYFTRADYVAAWDYIVSRSASRGTVVAVGRPFGPTQLWDSGSSTPQFGPAPFTMSVNSNAPGTIVQRITDAKNLGHKLILNMTGTPFSDYMTGGVFDINKWKARVSLFNTTAIKNAIATGVSNGTVLGVKLIDEPETSKWNDTVDKTVVDAMSAYSHGIFPTLPCGPFLGVRGADLWHPTQTLDVTDFVYIAWAGWFLSADYARWVNSYVVPQFALKDGVNILYAINVIGGGAPTFGTRMTTAQITEWGTYLGGHSSALGLAIWRYVPPSDPDGIVFTSSAYLAAYQTVATSLATKAVKSWIRP